VPGCRSSNDTDLLDIGLSSFVKRAIDAGKISPDLSSAPMLYRTFKPPDGLRDCVEYLWIADSKAAGSGELAVHKLACGRASLIVQHLGGESAVTAIGPKAGRDPTRSRLPAALILGQIDEAHSFRVDGPLRVSGASLKPHVMPSLFRAEAHQFTNQLTDLALLAPREARQLVHAPSLSQRVQMLCEFLFDRLHAAKSADKLIQRCLELIQHDVRLARVSKLRDLSGLSQRQFEKRFLRAVGLSAQCFIRVERFNAALKLMKTRPHAKLTDIAHELNFSDQSHFVRDVKGFSGCTPRQLLLAANGIRGGFLIPSVTNRNHDGGSYGPPGEVHVQAGMGRSASG
jgi:AraC-like DNA-binding protein